MALYPSTIPIPQMTPDQLWASYIRPMGAGAVAASGLITLIKTLPTIFAALTAGMKDVRAKRESTPAMSRTERDLSMQVVVGGSVVILAMMWAFLTFKPVPGAQTGLFSNLLAATFRDRVRIFVRDGGVAHQRADRQLVESDQRHDDRDADGHLRGVSGDPAGRRALTPCWR